MSSSFNVFLVMILATTYFRVITAQAVANFTMVGTDYNCSSNMICLGEAHAFAGDPGNSSIEDGRLSLISSDYSAVGVGIAYYKQPVKLLDLSSNRAASFSTSFTIDVRRLQHSASGDGMAFLMTANSGYIGDSGPALGIFDDILYTTPFKSIVVEFDTDMNDTAPINDINNNHVSFDFMNITAAAVADCGAPQVAVNLGDELRKYAWVEYNRDTLQLEARVSYSSSRPISPLLSYAVNLSDFVEEIMWVGFSSSSGGSSTNFYIGNWTFESSGIPGAAGNQLGLLVGIPVGVVAFLLVCVTVIALFMRRRRSGRMGQLERAAFTGDNPMVQMERMPERFSYKQNLSMATRGFSEETKLGQGGFGSVYRGVLPTSGIAVAVKKIKSDSYQGEKEFMAEVSIISQLRHRNLIQLEGWCRDASKGKYLLVFELMPNGSLDKVLFQPPGNQKACLSWAQRFNIVTGTAAALDYLHQGWKQQVIHRDIKSANIMLDEEWNAKLGDFGLARLVDHKRVAATTMVAGTYGYIAPEAATTGRFTDKTDVFAFGALVLEITCGRRALSLDLPEDEIILVDWVWKSLSEGALLNTIDKRLVEYDTHWIEVVLNVGLLCSHPNPSARPTMRQVVQVLAGDALVPSIPASKPAPFISDPAVFSVNYLHGSQSWSGSQFRSRSI